MRPDKTWVSPSLVSFLGLLFLWELGVSLTGTPAYLLPRPSMILASGVAEIFGISESSRDVNLLAACLYTAKNALGGFFLGSLLGTLMALLGIKWRFVQTGVLPLATALNSIPLLVIAPITNNWFGIASPFAKVSVVSIMVFFPVLINVARGLTLIDSNALELMKSYGSDEMQIIRKLRIPNALPYFFSAIKIVVPLSIIGSVVTEYFGGPRDALGIYMTHHAAIFHFTQTWVAIVLLCVAGIFSNWLVLRVEHFMLGWHVSQR